MSSDQNTISNKKEKFIAGFFFILSLPCGIIAIILLWIALLEPGVYINDPFLSKIDSIYERAFIRTLLVFVSMIFFVPQLGTLRRVLGYHTFLPRSMSSFLGFTLLGIAIVGAFTMWIKGAVAGIEGMVGLLFMGLLFVQISRKK